eukprot:7743-Alexandrium_andersonii.AAC.1
MRVDVGGVQRAEPHQCLQVQGCGVEALSVGGLADLLKSNGNGTNALVIIARSAWHDGWAERTTKGDSNTVALLANRSLPV